MPEAVDPTAALASGSIGALIFLLRGLLADLTYPSWGGPYFFASEAAFRRSFAAVGLYLMSAGVADYFHVSTVRWGDAVFASFFAVATLYSHRGGEAQSRNLGRDPTERQVSASQKGTFYATLGVTVLSALSGLGFLGTR